MTYFRKKKVFIEGDDFKSCLNDEEEKQLIEQFNSVNLFDPKIDSLFKVIFGNPKNTDIAKSLIKAVLPVEEEIENLEFKSTEIYSNSNFSPNQRKVIVDIYAEEKDKGKYYIIEMQIHEVPNLLARAELSTSRIFDNLYTKNETQFNKKIYSINFLYYDMFPNDEDYYHHIFPHEFNKKNICIPFKDTVIIELKKFNEKFHVSEINEKLLNNEKQRRLDERKLWFAFLSKINVLYHKPSINSNKYLTIEREIKIKKKNDSQNQENVDKNQNENDEMKKVAVYIKNDISDELLRLLIKVGPIRKALELCVNLKDVDKYVSEVEDHTELDKKNKELEENKKEREEDKKRIEEKEKELEENKKEREEDKKRIEEKEKELEENKKEREEDKKRIEEKEKEIKEIKEKNKELEKELEENKKEREEKEKEREEKEKEREEKEKELKKEIKELKNLLLNKNNKRNNYNENNNNDINKKTRI
ncbi:PD-XK nuclease family transposase-domain-containing protein [Neocallimastix lanati (nom. inval.)]|nr:PD-XK nuclease family transposase-domain-containing protein [Neocallimastix sp. JGI-2020a]KAG4082649.1 PD-XK nuclease family transposase-domain-containing protein [Neocallimastix sp. JGI-2020a]